MQTVERPQGVRSSRPLLAICCQVLESRYCALVLPLDEQSLRGQSPPDVAVGQVLDQFVSRRLAERGLAAFRGAVGRHAPDSATLAAFQVESTLDVIRQ